MKINKKIIRLRQFIKSNVIASEARQSRRMTRLKAGKPISLLLALTIILSLFLVAVPMAGIAEATNYYVREGGDDSDSHDGLVDDAEHAWLTIQYAINTVSSGNTINVAEGKYDEGSLVFNKNDITLIGSGADKTTIITRSDTYGVSIGVDDITIENFTIEALDSISEFHLKISHNSRFTLENVKLHGPGRYNACMTGLDLNTVQDVIIKNVEITGYSKNGVSINARQSSSDTNSSNNISFEGITINNNGGSIGWAGIAFYTVADTGDGTGNITDVQFLGTNVISNNPMGIYVENIGGDVFITGGSAALSDNLIPLVAFNYLEDFPISIVDAYAENVFGVPVRLDNAFEDPPNSFLVSYWHNVASAGTAATRSEADGKPTIFNLVDDEWYVVDGMSIQDAIDAASESAGDTINVAAGIYTENIVINESVTLISDTGDYRTTGTILTGTTPIFLLQDSTNNVTIQGFKFQDVTAGAPPGVINDQGGAAGPDNLTVESNSFTNVSGPAIVAYGGGCSTGWLITDNKIDGVTGTDKSGLQLFALKNATISNNQISNTTYGGMILDGVESMVVSGNTISNVPQQGIQVGYSSDPPGPSSNVSILNNTVTNANTLHKLDKGGICIYPGQSNISVVSNTLTGNYQGFTVRDKSGAVAADVHVNLNNIYGNDGFGVGNFAQGGGTLDATNNWWGDATGPYHATTNSLGQGNAVSDNVKFIPFLASSGGVVDNKVSITKSGPPSANSGDDITYTITYKNIGTAYATKVKITETYPLELEYVSASKDPDEGTNNQWTIGTLAPGEGDIIKVNVHIK